MNVREDFLALEYLYGGVRKNSKAVLAAKNNIQDLFYAVKNKPHMWWNEFEIRMTNKFEIFNKDSGHQVHIDKLKLYLINKNIHANFLTTVKTTIETQMNVIPMTMTYSYELANYRNTVNQRLPN